MNKIFLLILFLFFRISDANEIKTSTIILHNCNVCHTEKSKIK